MTTDNDTTVGQAMAALATLKADRADYQAEVTSATATHSADTQALAGAQARVTDYTTMRDKKLTSGDAEAVVTIDAALARAYIDLEVAQAQEKDSAADLAKCEAALARADDAVQRAAIVVMVAERAVFAAEFMTAMDEAERLGTQLNHFTGARQGLPPNIVAALARIPKRDELRVPLNELRSGGFPSQSRWDARLAELTAADEPEQPAPMEHQDTEEEPA